MQRSPLNQVIPSLFMLGVLFSLTTLFWQFTFLSTPDTTGGAGLVVIGFELLALPIKWVIATAIFAWILNKPEFNNAGASFAKNYGKMTIIHLMIMVGGLTPCLVGILVLFQIIAPLIAAFSIPKRFLPYATEPAPTEA